jgi:hypothetical protein
MKKEVKIVVPNDWSAVTLKKYLELRKDMANYEDDKDAVVACMFLHLCDFPVEYINGLRHDTYNEILTDLVSFLNKIEYPLEKIIEIDGIEYGFEPNLSQMAYGAYVDITKYESINIDDSWAEIMSILYRPVTKKVGQLYEIQPYSGNIDKERFLNVTMDKHFGAVFFFKSLLMDLSKDTLSSLMDLKEISPSISTTLERSGKLIHQLSNLPMVTSNELTKLLKNP